jgi:hypothetical protein
MTNQFQATVGVPELTSQPGATVLFRTRYIRIEEQHGFKDLALDQLDGSVLALDWVVDRTHHIWGSAVMIAPGVALTAGHVIEEMRAKGFLADGGGYLLALGFQKGRMQIWNANCFTAVDIGDLSIINLVRATHQHDQNTPDHLEVNAPVMATRQPEVGEYISVIGFSASELTFDSASEERPIGISLLGGVGPITDIYPDRRDKSLPNPSICISTRTVGGMSGGAAFDKMGRLIGVISRGDDQSAFVSLLWPCVFTPLELAWPPGLFPGRTNLFTLTKQGHCQIQELERVSLVTGEDGTEFVEMRYDVKGDAA